MNARYFVILGGSALALASGAPVLAAPAKLSVETNVKLGYDTNPFLSYGDDLSSGYVEASIAPKIEKTTEKGSISAGGYYDRTQYQKHYSGSDAYGGDVSLQQRLTPKLSVFGALRYDSGVIGQNDDISGSSPVDNTDVNLIGLRRREDTYSASGGFSYQVTPKDTVNVDGGYTATRYNVANAGDNNNYGGRVGWQHAISPRTKIGVSNAVYRIDYDTPGMSTLIMEPAVTFSTELSPTWHFDGSLGVSFSDLNLPGAPDKKSKGVSGNVNLCHKGPKDDFCLYGDRSVTASGFGGTVERSQVGISYNRKLTERLSYNGYVSYTRSKSQSGTADTREYLNARGGFSYLATKKLKVGVQGVYRDVFGGRQVRGDYGGEFYATLNLPGAK